MIDGILAGTLRKQYHFPSRQCTLRAKQQFRRKHRLTKTGIGRSGIRTVCCFVKSVVREYAKLGARSDRLIRMNYWDIHDGRLHVHMSMKMDNVRGKVRITNRIRARMLNDIRW